MFSPEYLIDGNVIAILAMNQIKIGKLYIRHHINKPWKSL